MSKPPEFTDCAQVRDRIEAWLDEELAGEYSEAMALHLASCVDCEAELRLARRIRAELRSCPHFDTPRGVIENILEQTTRSSATRGYLAALAGGVRKPVWITAALACSVLVAATLLIHRPFAPTQLDEHASVASASEDARVALEQVVRLTRRAADEVRNEALLDHLVIPATRSLELSLRRTSTTDRDTTLRGSNSQGVDDA